MPVLSFLRENVECEGCQNRAEIMGAGAWQLDALLIGAGVVITLIVLYLGK